MIISVSRRTDIPAYYHEWFLNRIKEGFLLVRNPMNTHQVSRISLQPNLVDCIVFWTKNPKRMIKRLDELKEYHYYFQFTLNSYDKVIERNVPQKKYLIKTFIELSDKIGKEKVIWRYDPILLTEQFTKEYHYKWFEYLANRLSPYTKRCVISFLDLYQKTQRNLKDINVLPITEVDMIDIAKTFSSIAKKYSLNLETCSEIIDLDEFGIKHSKCIDGKLISQITGYPLTVDKDPNQREVCGCAKSIDVGAYNTCKHECLYCYANFNKQIVDSNVLQHDKLSPLLFGSLNGNEKITERKMETYQQKQVSLFDI